MSTPATLQVLGCAGAIAREHRTTAFLLDDDVLIDAGSGVGELELEQLLRIDDIVLSHSHLDHVLGVPLLADSVIRHRGSRPPIRVHGLPHTLEVLARHVFNNQLWPDFTRLPSATQPVLQLCPFEPGARLSVGAAGRVLRVLPAAHSVPAVGFALEAPGGDWVYTGDTGPNPALWPALAARPVRHLVIEITFPEAQSRLADQSGHHCPSTLVEELRALPVGATVHLTHLKPGEWPQVRLELAQRLPKARLQPLLAGEQFLLD